MWDLLGRRKGESSPEAIFGDRADTTVFTAPIVLSVAVAPLLWFLVPADSIPLLGYVLVVVLSDVAHVWSTLFRTHLDSQENARRWWLYNGVPPALFIAQTFVHYFIGEVAFWTVIGYLAIYHFVSQQFGFMMIAKSKARDFKNFRRDKYLLYGLAGFPIALWHSDATRHFDWFNREDPFIWGRGVTEVLSQPCLGGIRPSGIIAAGYAAFLLYYLYCVIRDVVEWEEAQVGTTASSSSSHRTCPLLKKHMVLAYSGLTWAVGVLCPHKMIALTFLNLFHAVPAYMIVFCCARNRWWGAADGGPLNQLQGTSFADALGRWMTRHKSRVAQYMLFLMALGVVEELLWEGLVWQDYSAALFDFNPETDYPHPVLYSATVAFLILPQTTHYVLDMFIWKMGKAHDKETGQLIELNPGLRRHLGM